MAKQYVLAPPDTPDTICYRKQWHDYRDPNKGAAMVPATQEVSLVEIALGSSTASLYTYLMIDDEE